MAKRKASDEKEPDRRAEAPATSGPIPNGEPKVPDRLGVDKVPDELGVAYGELAKLDSVLAGGQAVAIWLGRMLRPRLDEEAPKLERDDITQVVDAIGAVQAGLDTAREHVQTIKAEVGRRAGSSARQVALCPWPQSWGGWRLSTTWRWTSWRG